MPPRAAKQAPRRATQRGRGAKPVRGRARGNRRGKNDKRFQEEPKIEEPPPPPPKVETWLDKLPQFDLFPDAELHKKLSKERKEKRYQKVFGYCHDEIEGMVNFLFDNYPKIHDKEYKESKQFRSKRVAFQKGEYLPVHEKPVQKEIAPVKSTHLYPIHSIDITTYLKISSSPFYNDLSNFFKVDITTDHISDPNKSLASLLDNLQNTMIPFIQPYNPPKLPFPFTIVINGPPGSGRTTACQFFAKVFDVLIIELSFVPPPDSSLKRRKGVEVHEVITEPPPPEYFLSNSILIKYSDDKSAIQQIANTLKESGRTNGIIICGFPPTKTVFSNLEKAISQGHTEKRPNSGLKSERASKSAPRPINGYLLTLNVPEKFPNRIVDPQTGFVYSRDFCWLNCSDLLGTNPVDFPRAKEEIEERLIEYGMPDTQTVTPKQVTQWSSFASSLKKYAVIGEIHNCASLDEYLQSIEEFCINLFKNSEHTLPEHFLKQLCNPKSLMLPGLCYDAVQQWKSCLEKFGRPIAEQNRLIATINEKVSDLTKTACKRFDLYCAIPDDRSSIKPSNYENRNELFNAYWDGSLNARARYLRAADDVVTNSGLIDLVFALLKSPRRVFCNLMEKLAYTRWFSEYHSSIFEKEAEFDFFRDPSQVTQPPDFFFIKEKSDEEFIIESCENFDVIDPSSDRKIVPRKLPDRPSDDLTIEERQRFVDLKGVAYISECFPTAVGKRGDVEFDTAAFCECLDLSFIPVCDLDEPEEFAKELASSVLERHSSPYMVDEIESSHILFSNICKVVKNSEKAIVNSVFELRDSLVDYAYMKTNAEMEDYSKGFLKGNPHFEYFNFNARIESLDDVNLICSLKSYIAQELVSNETIEKITPLLQTSLSLEEFEEKAKCVLKEEELQIFVICANILECSECFNGKEFLAALTK